MLECARVRLLIAGAGGVDDSRDEWREPEGAHQVVELGDVVRDDDVLETKSPEPLEHVHGVVEELPPVGPGVALPHAVRRPSGVGRVDSGTFVCPDAQSRYVLPPAVGVVERGVGVLGLMPGEAVLEAGAEVLSRDAVAWQVLVQDLVEAPVPHPGPVGERAVEVPEHRRGHGANAT